MQPAKKPGITANFNRTMIQCHPNGLQPGMVVAKSVFFPNGRLLVAAGHDLTQAHIDQLLAIKHPTICVQEQGAKPSLSKDTISKHVMKQFEISVAKVAQEIRRLTMLRDYSAQDIQKELRQGSFRNIVLSNALREGLKPVVDQVLDNRNVLFNLSSLMGTDPYLYTHAMNIAVMSMCIGRDFNYTREELEVLGTSALCCEIGMTALPKSILKKRGPLSNEEFELVKEHTTYGYLMLSHHTVVPPAATEVALAHHERPDGKGYPRGLRSNNTPPVKGQGGRDQIHRFAEIVAVVNSYDAMISKRPYHPEQYTPLQAATELAHSAGSQLNQSIVGRFLGMIQAYPIGVKCVVVSCPNRTLEGMRGIVAKPNLHNPAKPQLLLIYTRKGQKLNPPMLINMDKIQSLKIEVTL